VLRQLIAMDVLTDDHSAYGTLTLTEASGDVLRGNRNVLLRRELKTKRVVGTARERRGAATNQDLPPESLDLFERLRAWRAETAREHGVPAYVIFHDATLRQIAEARPRTLDQLRAISGVGAKKLEAYGATILDEVAELAPESI